MNILMLAACPGRVGIFATVEPEALRAEIGRSVDITRHYLIPCAQAHEVEREVRRNLNDRAVDLDRTWFATDFDTAVTAVTHAMQQLGADEVVVRGTIRIKPRCKLLVAA